jgi:hypothetical protein
MKRHIRWEAVAQVLLCTILMGMGSLIGISTPTIWQAVFGDAILAFFIVGLALPDKCKESVTEKSGEIEWL